MEIMWIAENLATILVCIFIAAAVIAVLCNAVENWKIGKKSCSCGCSGCTMKKGLPCDKTENDPHQRTKEKNGV